MGFGVFGFGTSGLSGLELMGLRVFEGFPGSRQVRDVLQPSAAPDSLKGFGPWVLEEVDLQR